ncbi:MAG TPA: hypothetical protein PKE69_10600 [Pyrinomonadaceae bacterium]|nr:hypothetical protein [Pyrinomonadaceae bacterium]
MKRFIFTLCLLVSFALLSLSAVAQKVETEGELFQKISKLTQTKKADDQEKAYKLSKTYLERFGKDDSENAKKIKAFVENHEIAKLGKLIDDGKTGEAFAFGKEILATNPENVVVTMELALAGLQASEKKKDKSFGKDSIDYAKTTLRLFGENKAPKTFAPLADQNEATAMMYYIVGVFSADDNLPEAANNFYKSLQYESKIKISSLPYIYIALHYHKIYQNLADEFEKKYANKPTSDKEANAANERLGKLLNLMMDAYARAAKIGEAQKMEEAANWKGIFTQIYKGVNQSEAGMNEYYDKILSQPLPDPSTF